ncbi:YfiR family protein [Desulforhopalus sp. 52FAK]
MRHIKASCTCLIYLGLVMSIIWGSGSALAGPRDEYAVKAAFILNFILLTDWPEDLTGTDGEEVVVCVVGFKNPPQSLMNLNSKKVRKKSLRIVAKSSGTTLPPCQVIFYSEDTDTDTLVRSLTSVRLQPVLTIGENSKVTRLGGAIHFYRDNDRLRFAINPRVVSEQGLQMSSRLLQIATLIND